MCSIIVLLSSRRTAVFFIVFQYHYIAQMQTNVHIKIKNVKKR